MSKEILKINTKNLRHTSILVDIIYSPKETNLLRLFKKKDFLYEWFEYVDRTAAVF